MMMTEDAETMPEAEGEDQDENTNKHMMTEEDAMNIAEIMLKHLKPELLKIEAIMGSVENITSANKERTEINFRDAERQVDKETIIIRDRVKE
eukprot:6646623-Heterocapsa_arctica.AAC.1